MSSELSYFVRRALTQGKTKVEVAAVLKQAGWAEDSIQAELKTYSDVSFVVPVPRPKPYVSSRDVFLYGVMFCALYCLCYHMGSLIFDMINTHFPDAAKDNYYSYQDSIRWSESALIISLPVFFFTFRIIQKEIAADPARRNSRSRKSLTYITLFIAVLTLMGDTGSLVYNWLSGELTTRFVLKVVTVAIIAGSMFIYFLRDGRRGEME